MSTNFLKRPTNHPSGISTGGGDTGLDVQPQKSILTKRCVAGSTADFVLPAGTTLFSTVVLPDPNATPAAGTIDLDNVTGSANVLNDVSATAAAITALAGGAVILAAETRYRITPTSLTANKAVLVGFEAILPRIRA